MIARWTVSDSALFLHKTAVLMLGMPREYVFRALVVTALRTPNITGLDRPLTVADVRLYGDETKRCALREHLRLVLEATHCMLSADRARDGAMWILEALMHAFSTTPPPTARAFGAPVPAGLVVSALPPAPTITMANIVPALFCADALLKLLYKSGLVQMDEQPDFTVVIETIFRVPNWLFVHAPYSRRDARAAFNTGAPSEQEACIVMIVGFLERLRVDYNLRTRVRRVSRDTLVDHVGAFFDAPRETVRGALDALTADSDDEPHAKRQRTATGVKPR
jgi:hypothetical protein